VKPPNARISLVAAIGITAALLSLVLAPELASSIEPKVLRFASSGELKSTDPYQINETFSLTLNGAVYEGLVRRAPDLKIEPALAASWEVLDPQHWRFHLRKGVKFHEGQDFTADDVVFSAQRVRSKGSDLKGVIPADADVVKVDDYTIDFLLKTPNPLLINQWGTWGIFSKSWSEAHDATQATAINAATTPYAALHANGTGPFILVSHEPGVKTIWKRNPNWWDTPVHNIDQVVFTPIPNAATRVAALLSGEIDWIDPAPLNDQARINANPAMEVLAGPEARTIYLGMDQVRDELGHSSVKGKNPFKDVRVRKAFYLAIDEDAINTKVMRGQATPSALMIAPSLFPPAKDFHRLPFDPEAAKKLLAEAGYPDGFQVQLDCPNDRYVNDEQICEAVVGMLARVNVKVDLNAQPKSKFFAQVSEAGGYDTSFFLMGWTPATLESFHVLQFVMGCRDSKTNWGSSNLGGYCNPKVDALARQALSELDDAKRDADFAEAWRISLMDDVAYIPLHQQPLAWGVSKSLHVIQPPTNGYVFRWARMD
jgi:peptide/nickel transport system substrate-binding protein